MKQIEINYTSANPNCEALVVNHRRNRKQKKFTAKVTESFDQTISIEERIKAIKSNFDFRKHLLYSPKLG